MFDIHGVQIDDKSKINMVIESLLSTFQEFKVNYILSNKDVTSIELMHELHIMKESYHKKKLPKKGSLQSISRKTRIRRRKLG